MKTPKITFPNNIYHYCKHNFVDKSLIDIPLNEEKQRLGALPYDWLKNVCSEKRAHITKEIDRLFREFAAKLNIVMINDNSIFESYYKDFELSKKLSDILKRNDIKTEYVDEGSYKYCHKITVGEYGYALLTFKRDYFFKNQLDRDTKNGSGVLLEPCRIFNFYKEYSHGRVAKPFMTRFVNDSGAKEYDGYMLMKFINKNNTARSMSDLPEFQKHFCKYLMTDFYSDNIINGVIVDIGKIMENPEAIKRSEFRQNLFNFLGMIERNHEENFTTIPYRKLNSNNVKDMVKANHNAEEFVYSLMEDGINIYDVDIREYIKNINLLEQKYVIKKIRKLKKAHSLKVQLQQTGTYEKYKQYIETYVKTFGSWTLKRELLQT